MRELNSTQQKIFREQGDKTLYLEERNDFRNIRIMNIFCDNKIIKFIYFIFQANAITKSQSTCSDGSLLSIGSCEIDEVNMCIT